MAKKRSAYRKRQRPQNRLSMVLVSVVVLLLLAAVSVASMELQDRLDVYTVKKEQLAGQIATEEEKKQEIEEYRKYTQTKKFVEEFAKEKLGLVFADEILFKEEE